MQKKYYNLEDTLTWICNIIKETCTCELRHKQKEAIEHLLHRRDMIYV